ncbi:MAG: pilus assembly protein PilM [Oscillospiraceae bacterium]|nr:pilus assembly protein PilM [Oscillospiraceae bacterium]
MLSFDITDRNIRIIKGTESGNKIRISSAATLELEEGLIINGHVKDIAKVAMMVNNVLKSNKMADKDAIVSISSNLTIFKELQLEKAKEQEFEKNVKKEMQDALGIDDSYSVSYIIVGDSEEESQSQENLVTVLATACPYEIIDSYKQVFQMLEISLKSVMIGCNCITKLLLADTKIKNKMPLLAVQIDKNFISLNLYEKRGKNGDCQLAFSRFASISAEDYDDSEDYVFEAVVENIYRMLQFQRSRNTGEIVENIIFYGEIGDNAYYKRLIDKMSEMDLNGDTLTAPPQIHGYDNLKFELFANAIGAMFKRNKETERINLLETDNVNNNKIKSNSTYKYFLLGVTVACAAVVGIAWGVLSGINGKIESDIEDIQAKINSPETAEMLTKFDNYTNMKADVSAYLSSISNLNDAMDSQPVILGEKYDELQKIVDKVGASLDPKIEKIHIINPQYSSGKINFRVQCDGVDKPSQKLPAEFVEKLFESDYFAYASYSGYVVTEQKDQGTQTVNPATGEIVTTRGTGKTTSKVAFTIDVHLNSEKSIFDPNATTTADEDTESGEAE